MNLQAGQGDELLRAIGVLLMAWACWNLLGQCRALRAERRRYLHPGGVGRGYGLVGELYQLFGWHFVLRVVAILAIGMACCCAPLLRLQAGVA